MIPYAGQRDDTSDVAQTARGVRFKFITAVLRKTTV